MSSLTAQEIAEIEKRHKERQQGYDYDKEATRYQGVACGPPYHQDIGKLLAHLRSIPTAPAQDAVEAERLRCFAWAAHLRDLYYARDMMSACGAMDAVISEINDCTPAPPEAVAKVLRRSRAPDDLKARLIDRLSGGTTNV